jgi:hypothetical protein
MQYKCTWIDDSSSFNFGSFILFGDSTRDINTNTIIKSNGTKPCELEIKNPNFRLDSITILSSSKNIELYNEDGEYICTCGAKSQQDGLFLVEYTQKSKLLNMIRLKFLSLKSKDEIIISNIHFGGKIASDQEKSVKNTIMEIQENLDIDPKIKQYIDSKFQELKDFMDMELSKLKQEMKK